MPNSGRATQYKSGSTGGVDVTNYPGTKAAPAKAAQPAGVNATSYPDLIHPPQN